MALYKGDTVGKKLARLLYWVAAREEASDHATNDSHLVLLSRALGDFRVAKGMGVEECVGVDVDPEAVRLAQMEFPSYRSICSRVEDVEGSFGHVLLDFCSCLSDKLIESALTTFENLAAPQAVVGVCLLRGRESRIWTRKIAQFRDGGPSIVRDLGKDDRDLGRSPLLWSELTERSFRKAGDLEECLYFEPKVEITYQSGPSPMMYALGLLTRDAKFRNYMRLADAMIKEAVEPGFERMLVADLTGVDKAKLGQTLIRCEDSFRRQGLEWDPKGLLNLTPGEAAALKAHYSRGTYHRNKKKSRRRKRR